jgi:hypothetical protein
LGSEEDPLLSAALGYRDNPATCPNRAQSVINGANAESSAYDAPTGRSENSGLRLSSPMLQDMVIRLAEG